MAKKGNGLKTMSNEIADRRNKFAFLVFKKIEEETSSWLEENGGAQHHADIEDIHDRASRIKDEIRQKHQLSVKHADKYEKQVPTIDVSVSSKMIRIVSDNWLEAYVGKYFGATDVDGLYDQIKERFGMFATMVYGKLEREIKSALRGVEKAFFRDRWLTAVKTDFDQRVTVPIFKLKKWVERVSIKTDSRGRPNPDYIPGMDILANWDLTRFGSFAQIYTAKTFHKGGKLKVAGVENKPWDPGTNPDTGKPYDADIWLECDGEKVPVQVGVREGELALKVSDAAVCLGEEIKPNEAVSKFGGTNMDYGKEPDFDELRKKLEQVPPGGIVLWMSPPELLPGSGPMPLKEWHGEIMDKKCVIVWVPAGNKAVIHHNNTGFDLTLARKLCVALGVPEPDEQTDSEDSLTEAVPNDVEGTLKHLAYMSAYLGRRSATPVVLADDLVPILRHVVEMYMKSAVKNADDVGKWKHYVETALSMLERVAKDGNIKLDPDVWVEICRILQDVVSSRYDDECPCETLSFKEIYSRLHLQALFCLTYMVIYRLGNKTPLEVQKTLTDAAKLDGQDGKGHRIVLGFALLLGLRYAIPDWYAENESLLFGNDSPDGMNSTLVRVCSHEGVSPIRTDMAHSVLDVQTMEKYHAVVLEALGEEMQHVGRGRSETRKRVEPNDLVRRFMRHVLHGSRGYEIENSVRNLANIGPDAVSVAGHECGFLIHDKHTENELVGRAVQFWEAVLGSSPEPEALYGFGWGEFIKSVDQDTWEQLMLRTCEAANGLVEDTTGVICRASSGGNPTESGIRIIESVLRADRSLLVDLAVSYKLGKMLENGVSIDIS